MLRYSHLIRS